MAPRRCLGIDLGGAASPTTGIVLLEGDGGRPRIVEDPGPVCLPKRERPVDGERMLFDLIVRARPDTVAIDAPLTLPPCLTCSVFCPGPGEHECETPVARRMWASGANPTSQRRCELFLRDQFGERPLPTMQLGALTARAIPLARRLRRERPEVMVLEVYPRVTRIALADRDERFRPREPKPHETRAQVRAASRAATLDALEGLVDRAAELRPELDNTHVLDALIAAYTGWLGVEGCVPPPEGMMREREGWIWFPRPATAA